MGVAAASILAPLAFWAAVAAASAMQPGYDQTASTISRLGVGANAAVMNAGFVAYGALTIAIAVVLRRRVSDRFGRAALSLLAASGAATASLGLQWLAWGALGLPVDSAPPRLTSDARYDLIHDALAVAAFAFSGLGSFLLGLGVRGRPGWSGYDRVFIGCALVVLVASTYLVGRPPLQGAAQRLAVVALQAWVAVLAIRLQALGPRSLAAA